MIGRSLRYCPGDEPGMSDNAVGTDADAVVFDLEDAVAPDSKGEARRTVRGTLESLDDPAPARGVRINPYDRTGRADVEAVVGGPSTPPDGVVLPTAAGADDVATLHDHLADLGATGVGIVPLIETAAGVVAAAAADVDAIDTVFTRIEDDDGLRTQAERIVEFGFDGKLAIHPAQVPIINEAFTPAPEDVEWAERVVERRRETGDGVFTVDGRMIDPPLIERARTILDRAAAAEE